MKSVPVTPLSALKILAVCVAVFALGQFQRASGSVFGPVLAARLDLPATVLGVLVGVMFASTLMSQAPAGIALDRFGPRRVLPWALGLVAVGTALFAIAPDLGSAAWPAVVVSRALIGAGLAATGASVQMALAQNLPAGDYGYASGLLVTLGGVGGLVGTWPLAVALERLPWSMVFGAAATLALLVMICTVLMLPDTVPAAKEGPKTEIGFRALLKSKELRGILCLGAVSYAPIVTITGLWGGPYLLAVHGLSPQAAGQALMGLFATTIAAGFAFGRLDRIGHGRNHVIKGAALGSKICLILIAILPETRLWAVLFLLGGSVFLQQFYIPLGVRLRDAVPPSAFGRANALNLLIATSAIPVMQVGFGLVIDLAAVAGATDAMSYRIAFGSMASVIGLAILSYHRSLANKAEM